MCDGNNKPSKNGGEYLDQATWDALKAVGFSDAELYEDQPTGPIIFSYSRKQAIEDGVLVDLTETARRHGFKVPVAATCGLMAELQGIVPAAKGIDVVVLMLLTLLDAIRRTPAACNSDRVEFRVGSISAYSLIGPGDHAEPVLTIMLEGED